MPQSGKGQVNFRTGNFLAQRLGRIVNQLSGVGSFISRLVLLAGKYNWGVWKTHFTTSEYVARDLESNQ